MGEKLIQVDDNLIDGKKGLVSGKIDKAGEDVRIAVQDLGDNGKNDMFFYNLSNGDDGLLL